MQLCGVIGSLRTIMLLYFKYERIVLGAGDSPNFDFYGDWSSKFGYHLYFFGSYTGCASELALVDPCVEAFFYIYGKIICLYFCKILSEFYPALLFELTWCKSAEYFSGHKKGFIVLILHSRVL